MVIWRGKTPAPEPDNSENFPGTDWDAKKRKAGSGAKVDNGGDRPYQANPSDLSPIDESDIEWRSE